MNLPDSSGWLEYFTDGANAGHFAEPLEDIDNLIVPTICLYEVFKMVLRGSGEDDAIQAVALMKQGIVVDLTQEITLLAAKISNDEKLPMADSIIFATAWKHGEIIWT
ncbi:MAG: PIN domain-containing protein [Candidatus Latescibacterota bacterium]